MSLEVAIARMKAAAGEARLYLAASRLKWALLERRYRPDQPRVPAGNRGGGQWTDDGGSSGNRFDVALAGVLIDQRQGVGDDATWIRMCTYQDYFGRQWSREIDAANLCPPTWRAPPYYGPLA